MVWYWLDSVSSSFHLIALLSESPLVMIFSHTEQLPLCCLFLQFFSLWTFSVNFSINLKEPNNHLSLENLIMIFYIPLLSMPMSCLWDLEGEWDFAILFFIFFGSKSCVFLLLVDILLKSHSYCSLDMPKNIPCFSFSPMLFLLNLQWSRPSLQWQNLLNSYICLWKIW